MTLPVVLQSVPPLLERVGGAAAGDSSGTSAEALARALERWHDFYLLSGTAAVTLVGLLFVALSFHLDAILDDARTNHLAAARMAFLNFLFVLVLSLFFLMPRVQGQVLGLGVLVLSTFSFSYIVWNVVRSRRKRAATKDEEFLRRRFVVGGFVFGVAIAAAAMLVLEPRPSHLLQFMFIAIVTLMNATTIAWDLLVQVGRQRKAAAEAPKA